LFALLIEGGPVMTPLGLCSIATTGALAERRRADEAGGRRPGSKRGEGISVSRVLPAALLLALLASGPAQAAYSGLTVVPTADVLAPGQACVDYQVYTPTAFASGPEAVYVNTQYALGSRAEVGMDFDLTQDAPTGAVLNGKLALLPLDTGIGLAAGIYNAGENLRPISYLAATAEVSDRLRLHAGAHRTPDEESQGFVGAEYQVGQRVWLWGEYLAGDENASAATLYYQLSDHWGISIGLQRPNDRECDDSLVLDIGCVHPAW